MGKKEEEKAKYLALLVESAAYSIISTAANGIVTSINRAGEKMFGYRANELIGRPVSVLWSDETSKELREKLSQLAAKGESWEAESLGVRKSGEVFPIWLVTSYLYDETGKLKAKVCIEKDVTELKKEKTMEGKGLEKPVDRIAIEVVKHTEAINELVTDVTGLKDKSTRLIDGQDKMIAILNRLDQERIFTFE